MAAQLVGSRLLAPSNRRLISTTPPALPKTPPQPRPFKAPSPEERLTRRQAYEESEPPLTNPTRIAWPWPFSSLSSPPRKAPQAPVHQPAFYNADPKDPDRGLEAARAAIVTGKLDPRYRSARNRVLTILVGLPFVLVLSYELLQRRFYGKAKKVRGARVQGEQQESEYGVVPTRVWDETGEKS